MILFNKKKNIVGGEVFVTCQNKKKFIKKSSSNAFFANLKSFYIKYYSKRHEFFIVQAFSFPHILL
jgi:hypothetical protein